MDDKLKEQKREEIFNKLKPYLDEGDTDSLYRESAKQLLNIVTKFTDRICKNATSKEISVDIILRCVAQKTQESLSAITELVSSNKSYQANTILRPMCEEYIFAKFITSIPEEDAKEFISNKAMLEITQGKKAQHEFFPRAAKMLTNERIPKHEIDNNYVEILKKLIVQKEDQLKEIGNRIGWGRRTSPTVRYMAEKTDLLDIYEFFYHASSSTVHASLHHLLRMVWGDPKTSIFNISNDNFQQYYSRFALIYGSWLAMITIYHIASFYPDEWPQEDDLSFGVLLALTMVPAVARKAPQIVTDEELRWSK